MLDRELCITVPGDPAPKGSLRCIARPGEPHRLIEDNTKTKGWRKTIVTAAAGLWPLEQRAAAGQPIGAEVTITIERPAGHFGTGRNAGVLKASAPSYPTTRSSYDVDKLLRLVLDALQDADVLADDAAVVEVIGRKRYAVPGGVKAFDVLDRPGAVIRLTPMNP